METAVQCIQSKDLVLPNPKSYRPIQNESSGSIGDDSSLWKTVALEYPASNAREWFPLAEPIRKDEYNPLSDLKSTSYYIVTECISGPDASVFGDASKGLLRSIIKACNRKSPNDLETALSEFNQAIGVWRTKNLHLMDRKHPASPEFIDFVLEQSYSRAVSPHVSILKSYKGFSNNVYGEVKHKFVCDLIAKTGLQSHHCFLDLGSGVGSVVLQVAAETLCEAYGIEIMDNPAMLAQKQSEEFICRMRYYNKPCGKITLKHGDFLEDPEIHSVLKRADIIFVNKFVKSPIFYLTFSYAFDAELNQSLLARFLDLKETAKGKVISLKSFASLEKRQIGRRSNAIENIFSVKEYFFGQNCVSWMNEAGRFYVHTLNR
ncbi:Nucleosomal histone H3-Lys79 methylase [Dinochytrium kinnereticum]|nr:Nucleosomal histone H3-Lys79 methylase [Dinochytrium kinnereticum]